MEENYYMGVTDATGNVTLSPTPLERTNIFRIYSDKIDNKEPKESNYLIGYLDILGFKDMIDNNPLNTVYNSVHRVFKDLKDALDGKETKSFTRGDIPSHIEPYVKQLQLINSGSFIFSDTVIFFIESPEEEEESIKKFEALCWLMNKYIVKSILTPRDKDGKPTKAIKSVAFRGAISYGPCIMDTADAIFLGQPIIDAYELAESQNWMGGIVDKSIDKKWVREIVGVDKKMFDKEIFDYCVPSCHQPTKYALNWPQAHHDFFRWQKMGIPLNSGPTIEDLTGHINRHGWGDQEEKKENTLKFARVVCKECEYERAHRYQHT